MNLTNTEIMKAYSNSPKNHTLKEMCKTGSIVIGHGEKSVQELMCLECRSTWTTPDSASLGDFVCPHGCNRILDGTRIENCDSRILDSINNLLSRQVHEDRRVTKVIDKIDNLFNQSIIITGTPWMEALFRLWCVATEINPDSLTLSTIRNYIAHLWKWFENCQLWEQGEGLEETVAFVKSLGVEEHPLFDLAKAKALNADLIENNDMLDDVTEGVGSTEGELPALHADWENWQGEGTIEHPDGRKEKVKLYTMSGEEFFEKYLNIPTQ